MVISCGMLCIRLGEEKKGSRCSGVWLELALSGLSHGPSRKRKARSTGCTWLHLCTLEWLRASVQFLCSLRKAALHPTTVLPTTPLEQKPLERNHTEELTVWSALGRIVPCSCRHAHLSEILDVQERPHCFPRGPSILIWGNALAFGGDTGQQRVFPCFSWPFRGRGRSKCFPTQCNRETFLGFGLQVLLQQPPGQEHKGLVTRTSMLVSRWRPVLWSPATASTRP